MFFNSLFTGIVNVKSLNGFTIMKKSAFFNKLKEELEYRVKERERQRKREKAKKKFISSMKWSLISIISFWVAKKAFKKTVRSKK